MDYNSYLTSEGSNNRRAVFFAYLAYCKAVSECIIEARISVLTALAENTVRSSSFDAFSGGELESPFEEEVYQSLADSIGTEKLIPQFQFAGFRIDIVYDPKIIGIPKIAIECDGAKYHSSREAYLHDRHRQKILEDHGFIFHRIWSTNWWRNPKRETDNLLDFIRGVENTEKSDFIDHSKISLAFTDDIIPVEESVSKEINHTADYDTIKVIDDEKEVSQKLEVKETINKDSKVRVKYVNNGKDITVQLVASENNKNTGGVQNIFFKSALANSLIGHSIGDIVKVGNLDNYVEILSIL